MTLKTQLKSETSTSKKTIREMETSLTESQARSQKCEREYITLRDSLKGLVESFKADHEGLREEMRKREEKMRKEAEEVRKKYLKLLDDVKRDREADGRGMKEVMRLKEESEMVRKEVEEGLKEEVQRLRAEVDRLNKESEGAIQTAKYVFICYLRIFAVLSTFAQKSCRGIGSTTSPHARKRCRRITIINSSAQRTFTNVTHIHSTLRFCISY